MELNRDKRGLANISWEHLKDTRLKKPYSHPVSEFSPKCCLQLSAVFSHSSPLPCCDEKQEQDNFCRFTPSSSYKAISQATQRISRADRVPPSRIALQRYTVTELHKDLGPRGSFFCLFYRWPPLLWEKYAQLQLPMPHLTLLPTSIFHGHDKAEVQRWRTQANTVRRPWGGGTLQWTWCIFITWSQTPARWWSGWSWHRDSLCWSWTEHAQCTSSLYKTRHPPCWRWAGPSHSCPWQQPAKKAASVPWAQQAKVPFQSSALKTKLPACPFHPELNCTMCGLASLILVFSSP